MLKKVEPKKKKFEEVQASLAEGTSQNWMRRWAEVNKVKEAVAKLEADCQRMQDEKERLESDDGQVREENGKSWEAGCSCWQMRE